MRQSKELMLEGGRAGLRSTLVGTLLLQQAENTINSRVCGDVVLHGKREAKELMSE